MGWFFEILRTLSAKIDWGIYNLAETIYKVFVAITNTEIINAAEIQKFTNRVYVIIGAFMIFKVALAMLKYLVNPDSFSNSGTGYNKLIWNICTALILLVMMPTIYNYAMRIQNTVVNDGIIERLVLGTSGENNSGDENRLLDSGPKLSFTILSAFVMPDYDHLGLQGSGGACTNMYSINEDTGKTILNPTCQTALEGVVDEADKEAVGQYADAIENNDINLLLFGEHSPLNARLSGEYTEPNEDYTFLMKYRWGISWIVGIFLCFIFLSFCIDIAIRSIKIAFLMLIAPIPILSMVNPEKGAKGMLSKWWEMAWATYLDLFLRLTSIYFIIYILTRVQDSGVWTQLLKAANGSVAVSVFAMVFIIIGGLLFAKQLPDMVVKLFPAMDGVVKGGFNPLKKMADAANVVTKAPLVGKGVTGLANRFGAQLAMNRGIKKQEAQKRKDNDKKIRDKMQQVKNNAEMSEVEKDKKLEELQKEKEKFDSASREREKKQRKENAAEAKFLGQQAASEVSVFGGDSKPMTSFGATMAKINKENADKVHKMQMASLKELEADKNLSTVKGKAEAERKAEIDAKEKQILDVQRQAEVERRMKELDTKNMRPEEIAKARADIERNVQDELNQKLQDQAVEKRAQAKIAGNMDKSQAYEEARNEVKAMSKEEIAKEGNAAKVYSDMAGDAAASAAQKRGASKQEVESVRTEASKKSRTEAEDKVVGTLSDKMDEVAERQGIIYNSSEYAEQVKITREAKNRRNAIQSEYEKAARQQQYEGKVTTSDGRELVGQAAIDYVDKLRVDYTKASGDYDFMSKELDSLGEKYPDDAATRKGYEDAKDYYDKKSKVTKYASKSSYTSDNEREGAQYTVQELIGEDTVVNSIRRADVNLAASTEKFVTRKAELESNAQILEAKIKDQELAGNAEEVLKLKNELNINSVELGRVNTSIASAQIARNNAVNGLYNESMTIDNKLKEVETEYAQLDAQSRTILSSGSVDINYMNNIQAQKEKLENDINLLRSRSKEIDSDLNRLGVSKEEVIVPNINVADTRISGADGFDNIGTPIRVKFDNIINQMEYDVQRMTDTTLSNEERVRAKMAVTSALKKYADDRKAAGSNIHSGMNDQEKQQYEVELNNRISQIVYKLQSDSNDKK